MAFNHGSVAQILFAGFDASPYFKEISQSLDIDTAETSAFGTKAKTYVPGLIDSTLSLSGYFDNNTDAPSGTLNWKLDSLQRQEFSGIQIPGTDSAGDTSLHWKGLLTSHEVDAVVDDVVSANIEVQSNTGLQRGILLRTYTNNNVSGSGTSTGLNNTVASSGGATAVLHLGSLSGSGGPALVVKVQTSADSTNGTDGTWADLITFTSATAKTTEYKEVTGVVNKYVRLSWTLSGTSPSASFTVSFARK